MLRVEKIRYLFLILLAFLCSCFKVFAQQNMIEVPSSSVLPEGHFILKESNNAFFNDFTQVTPSVIYGIGNGMAISAGVQSQIGEDTIVRGDFGVKKVFFLSDGFRVTAGARVRPYFNLESEPDMFVYSHLTYRIKKTKTTLTAGGYSASRREAIPSNVGAILGIEQVLIPNKLALVSDYTSRDDRFGRFCVGFKYRPIPTLSVTSAVMFPSQEKERVGFKLSVSKYFSIKDFIKEKEEKEVL